MPPNCRRSVKPLSHLSWLALLFLHAPHGTAQDHLGTPDNFITSWNEQTWEKEFRGIPGYMRPLSDQDWKIRMAALQAAVRVGDPIIPQLLTELRHSDSWRRIFAAQVLGYLGKRVPPEQLVRAATTDPDATVRLYAVDSLGMIGYSDVDFESMKEKERNRDVRMHINYAKKREGVPLTEDVVNTLKAFDVKRIDSVALNQEAPDFALQSVTGEEISLSAYRGKSAVALVFIYGDT